MDKRSCGHVMGDIPAVVVKFQTIKARVQSKRIFPVKQNEIGVPVQTRLPFFCHADYTSVRFSVVLVAVIRSCTT